MSGAYGLCWMPTGPEVLADILGWLGFPEVRCSTWRHAPGQRDDLDRIEVIAARTPGFFDAWDATVPDGPEGMRAMIQTRTRPGATVLVAGGADAETFAGAGRDCRPAAGEPEELERRRAEGASYLVLDPAARERLAEQPALASYLTEHSRVIVDTPACRIYALEEPA